MKRTRKILLRRHDTTEGLQAGDMMVGSKHKRPLRKGQVWKTRVADIQIIGMGKHVIHYKVTKQLGLRQVGSQVSGIEALANYLRANRAQLAKDPCNN